MYYHSPIWLGIWSILETFSYFGNVAIVVQFWQNGNWLMQIYPGFACVLQG
jgi:hypothetical protein